MTSAYVFDPSTALITLPDTSALQAEVEGEYKAEFGQDLVVTPDTPQGVLITAEVLARADVARNNAAVANQINPDYAGGTFLDAIWKLTGGQRSASASSVIPGVVLSGVPGTNVPAGSIASTPAGLQAATLSAVVIGVSGSVSVDMAAVIPGPSAFPIGSLSQVVSGVLGWETVTNPTAATLGRLQESDTASRKRRRNTLGIQGTALAVAITSYLYNVTGVTSLTFRENKGDAPATIDGVLMGAHSVWACVAGGSDADIAQVLLDQTSMGAGFNGSHSLTLTGPLGQSYVIQWERPTPIQIRVRATVRVAGGNVDAQTLVTNALLAYTSGALDGEDGFVVGAQVSPFELGGAVNIQSPGVYVQKLEVAKGAGAFGVTEIPIAVYEQPTLVATDITVIIV